VSTASLTRPSFRRALLSTACATKVWECMGPPYRVSTSAACLASARAVCGSPSHQYPGVHEAVHVERRVAGAVLLGDRRTAQ
jgi:hypothetical protein